MLIKGYKLLFSGGNVVVQSQFSDRAGLAMQDHSTGKNQDPKKTISVY